MTETARLLNISNHGALIESPLAVTPDSMQSVQFTIGDQPMTVDVRVRHSRSVLGPEGLRYLIGVEFVAPPTTLLTSIERLELDDRAGQKG